MAKAKGEGKKQPPPPLVPVATAQFKKDFKRLQKRGKDMGKLRAIVVTLCARRPLARQQKDHPLEGEWKDWRECHVEPDWLLIYRALGSELIQGRTGTHADLFDE